MKILIVGAGPTGLTAAVEFARRGIVPEVIDRKDSPSSLSRAVGITPRSQKILEPSGVTARLVEEGIAIRSAIIFSKTEPILSLDMDLAHPEHDYGILALAQDRTEAALRSAFESNEGSVQYGTELTSLRQDADSVIVTKKGVPGEERYDYVIGADGIGSATREQAGIEYPGFELPETWSIADIDAGGWEFGDSFCISMLGGGNVVVIVPLEKERYRLVSDTENALERFPFDIDVRNIRREGQFTISVRQVREYVKGRVLLAGDAAHCHSPVGGRGMNLGIADAAELVERYCAGTLEGYSESRHVDGKRTIDLSERGRKMVTSGNPLVRGAMRTLLFAVDKSETLQQKVSHLLLYG